MNPFDEYSKALIRWLLLVLGGLIFALLITLVQISG
jgi:hypothetical protein